MLPSNQSRSIVEGGVSRRNVSAQIRLCLAWLTITFVPCSRIFRVVRELHLYLHLYQQLEASRREEPFCCVFDVYFTLRVLTPKKWIVLLSGSKPSLGQGCRELVELQDSTPGARSQVIAILAPAAKIAQERQLSLIRMEDNASLKKF